MQITNARFLLKKTLGKATKFKESKNRSLIFSFAIKLQIAPLFLLTININIGSTSVNKIEIGLAFCHHACSVT